MPIENPKGITEDEQKDTTRFEELNKVPETERTDEQKTELGELKERYGKRMQKKIDSMHAKAKMLEEENEKLQQELEEARKPKEPDVPLSPEGPTDEVIEFGGKKYFTDRALIAQVRNKEITEEEAYAYQRKRDKEEIKEDLRREHTEETKRTREITERKDDAEKVNREYPHFNKKDPNFNPEDPLYKLTNELYTEAYAVNPRGLSLAIKRAKEILRVSDETPDRSDDFGIEGSEALGRRVPKDQDITLSSEEKEAAIAQFTRGDVMNPKTNRPYTENEAVAKALFAKKERRARRRI